MATVAPPADGAQAMASTLSRRAGAVATGLCLAVIVVYVVLPFEFESDLVVGSSGHLAGGNVVLVAGWLRTTIRGAFMVAVALLIGRSEWLSTGARLSPGFLRAIGSLAIPAVLASTGFFHLGSTLSPWRIQGRLDTGARSFAFLDQSFLQGQTLALAESEARNVFFERFAILGTTGGDNPRSYASVVCARGQEVVRYGELRLSADARLVIGLRQPIRGFFAYDLEANHFMALRAVEMLSPFALLGSSDAPSPDEMRQVVAHLDECWERAGEEGPRVDVATWSGVPSRRELERSLASPNAGIAAAAKQLLEHRVYADANEGE